MVGKERLELSRISALDPKSSVATITPLALKMVGDEGIEPPRLECKSSRLPLHQSPKNMDARSSNALDYVVLQITA